MNNDFFRELNAKKYEIIGDLERVKAAIMAEMSSVDHCTLTRLREIIAHYDRLEKLVIDKVNSLETKTSVFISSTSNDFAEVQKVVEELKHLSSGVQDFKELSDRVLNTLNEIETEVEQVKVNTYPAGEFVDVADIKPAFQIGKWITEGRRSSQGAAIAEKDKLYVFNVLTDGDSDALLTVHDSDGNMLYSRETTLAGHGNSATYVEDTDEWMIAPCGGQSTISNILVCSFDLSTIRTVPVEGLPWTIAYDKWEKGVWVTSDSAILYSPDLTRIIRKVTISQYVDALTGQGAFVSERYIFYPRSAKGEYYVNKLDVFNKQNGEYVTSVRIPVKCEVEDGHMLNNGTVFLSCNGSSGCHPMYFIRVLQNTPYMNGASVNNFSHDEFSTYNRVDRIYVNTSLANFKCENTMDFPCCIKPVIDDMIHTSSANLRFEILGDCSDLNIVIIKTSGSTVYFNGTNSAKLGAVDISNTPYVGLSNITLTGNNALKFSTVQYSWCNTLEFSGTGVALQLTASCMCIDNAKFTGNFTEMCKVYEGAYLTIGAISVVNEPSVKYFHGRGHFCITGTMNFNPFNKSGQNFIMEGWVRMNNPTGLSKCTDIKHPGCYYVSGIKPTDAPPGCENEADFQLLVTFMGYSRWKYEYVPMSTAGMTSGRTFTKYNANGSESVWFPNHTQGGV